MNPTSTVNPQRTASFDVDAQNSFTPLSPDELPVAEGHCIAGELNRQAAFASLRIGSKDAHSPSAVWVANEHNPPLSPVKGHANADLHWPLHAVPGTHGFALLDELPAVTDYDFFVWKGIEPTLHPYGACFHDLANRLSTGVIEFLQARGIDTVLVGGLATDYCVLNTVLQLRTAGLRVIVNRAAVRGVAEDSTAQALAQMADAGVQFIDDAGNLQREPGTGDSPA